MDPRHAFGREAEQRAEAFYRQQGYLTVARNFRAKAGEIDLVLRKQGLLLFVEVKGRTGCWRPSAWAPSWRGKGRRVRAAIGAFLAANPELDYREIRIEIVFVTPTRVAGRYEGI